MIRGARQGAHRAAKAQQSCRRERLNNSTPNRDADSRHQDASAHDLETATTATALPAGAVSRNRGDILDTADLHAGTGQGTERSLGTGAGGLGLDTTSGADLDVEGGDAELLAAGGHILSGKHSRVGGGLVTIGLHLHATSDAHQGLTAGKISNVDEGVVEGRENAGDGEDVLAVLLLRAERHGGFLGSSLLGGHCSAGCTHHATTDTVSTQYTTQERTPAVDHDA
jgi:hypothetical protein